MNISITHKLFFAILTAAGLAVVSLVLIMQWNLSCGFLRYVNTMETASVSRLASTLEQSYSNELNWEFVLRDRAQWRELVKAALPDGGPPPPGQFRDDGERPHRPRPAIRHFTQRLFLLDGGKKPLLAQDAVPVGSEMTTLHHKGKVIGYLGLLPRTNLADDHQRRFLREQKNSFVMVAGVIVLLAAGLSLLLAKRLVRPIGELAKATDRLAAGDFAIRVPNGSKDELGRLAQDFNALAQVLEKNEQARRQWVADVSHELRTPLAVLRGELEALQDGLRQPSPDSIRSLHGEVLRLGRLVDDLYQLSLSDLGALTYKKRDLDVAKLLAEALHAYRQEFLSKDIAVVDEIPRKGQFIISGDAERLHQLFGNLLDNALKYTNGGGQLQVTMEQTARLLVINFQDSAPGVPLSDLDRLFDRLYRVESSRNRLTGGAGLGLAICRNIVEAHGGSITAQLSPIGGVWIRIELPQKESC